MAQTVEVMKTEAIIDSIAVGRPQEVEFDNKKTLTSIFKSCIDGPVSVRKLNIDGDVQSDLSVHGGRNKAIYVYSSDYYARWAHDLGATSLEPSQFGENLTVSGVTDSQVILGSTFQLGTAKVTVTQPRIPCFKLGLRLKDATFPKQFWDAGRLGFYLRVDNEGMTEAGQSLQKIEQPAHGITVRDLYEIVTIGKNREAGIALELLPHLDEGWRRRLRAISNSTSGRI